MLRWSYFHFIIHAPTSVSRTRRSQKKSLISELILQWATNTVNELCSDFRSSNFILCSRADSLHSCCVRFWMSDGNFFIARSSFLKTTINIMRDNPKFKDHLLRNKFLSHFMHSYRSQRPLKWEIIPSLKTTAILPKDHCKYIMRDHPKFKDH